MTHGLAGNIILQKRQKGHHGREKKKKKKELGKDLIRLNVSLQPLGKGMPVLRRACLQWILIAPIINLLSRRQADRNIKFGVTYSIMIIVS